MGFFIVVVFSMSAALCVFDDLSVPPRKDMSPWFSIAFPQNHKDRQPNQAPDEWSNVTFGLPYGTVAVQFTIDNKTNLTEKIVFYAFDKTAETLTISVIWWGYCWDLNIWFK